MPNSNRQKRLAYADPGSRPRCGVRFASHLVNVRVRRGSSRRKRQKKEHAGFSPGFSFHYFSYYPLAFFLEFPPALAGPGAL